MVRMGRPHLSWYGRPRRPPGAIGHQLSFENPVPRVTGGNHSAGRWQKMALEEVTRLSEGVPRTLEHGDRCGEGSWGGGRKFLLPMPALRKRGWETLRSWGWGWERRAQCPLRMPLSNIPRRNWAWQHRERTLDVDCCPSHEPSVTRYNSH